MGKPIKRIFSFFEEGEGESEGLSLSRSNILALKESGSIPNWLIIQKLEGRGGGGGQPVYNQQPGTPGTVTTLQIG